MQRDGGQPAAAGDGPERVRLGVYGDADGADGRRHGRGGLELTRRADGGWDACLEGPVNGTGEVRREVWPALPPELVSLLGTIGLLLLAVGLDGLRVWDFIDGWIDALPLG